MTQGFQEVVELAAELTDCPMAAISILDDEAQRFKARVGIVADHTPIEHAFCRFTVQSDTVMTVEDARLDERFRDNPLVTGDPNIRAYAGAPLVMPNGERVGAICVIDDRVRRFGPRESELLALIAKQVVAQLELEQMVDEQAADISELRIARSELRHQATHDDLTDLLNRRGFVNALDNVLHSNHPSTLRHPPPPLTVLFIDLDNFKTINDTMGHVVGDEVLIAVAERLVRTASANDLVGRLGGDEFALALGSDGLTSVDPTVEQILEAFSRPFAVGGEQLVVRASIGVVEASVEVRTALQLLDRADRAMYAVKKNGGGRQSARNEVTAVVNKTDRRGLGGFVRTCLTQGNLEAHFQPVRDLMTGDLLRREALLRWTGDGPSGASTGLFIAAAEEHGLIDEVGPQMLLIGCAAAATWQRDDPGVGVSVNVSPLQLHADLISHVDHALSHASLQPDLLTLEITESNSIEASGDAPTVLRRLRDLGVRLSMDDFGTGYSSMAMLSHLRFDGVKIDRQFCEQSTLANRAVVTAAVGLGDSLGIEVIAEGIETIEMQEELIDLGCVVGQGYLLGRPVSL